MSVCNIEIIKQWYRQRAAVAGIPPPVVSLAPVPRSFFQPPNIIVVNRCDERLFEHEWQHYECFYRMQTPWCPLHPETIKLK